MILDGIEDPRNLGAILRCCAAAGVSGVVIPSDHVVGLTSVVSKTAEGALEYLRIARVTNLVRAIQEIKEKGLWVVGVETGQEKRWYEIDYSGPIALVFGNEGDGMRQLTRENSNSLLSIPTPGPIYFLNVCVATGIAVFRWWSGKELAARADPRNRGRTANQNALDSECSQDLLNVEV